MSGPRPGHHRPDCASRARRCLFLGMHRLLPVFPVLVSNQQRDWGTQCFARPHARENLGLVRLNRHPATTPIPTLAPFELFGDRVEVQMETGRHPFQNGDEALAMRLTSSEKTQHCHVILYEVSAPSGRRTREIRRDFRGARCLQHHSCRMLTLIADRFVCRRPILCRAGLQPRRSTIHVRTRSRNRRACALQDRICRHAHRSAGMGRVVHARVHQWTAGGFRVHRYGSKVSSDLADQAPRQRSQIVTVRACAGLARQPQAVFIWEFFACLTCQTPAICGSRDSFP